MTKTKAIVLIAIAVVALPLSLVRFGTHYTESRHGEWTAPASLKPSKIIIMRDGRTSHTYVNGSGAETVTANITEEHTHVPPWLFLPIVQRGQADAKANVELRAGDAEPVSITVTVQRRYAMFGLLPDFSVRKALRRQIDNAIQATIQARIKESQRNAQR